MPERQPVVGARLVRALLATFLVVGGLLIFLLGLVALAASAWVEDAPVSFAAAILALGGTLAGVGLLLGRGVRSG